MSSFTDDFIKQMDEAMGQLCNFDRMLESKRRDYGCGIEMSTREIHALEIIYNHPHFHTTELTILSGMTCDGAKPSCAAKIAAAVA